MRKQDSGGVTGDQVTVQVMRGGREIREIERPLRIVNGQRAVVFKGRFWKLRPGNRIAVDEAPLAEKDNGQAKPPTVPKITGQRSKGNAIVSTHTGTNVRTPPVAVPVGLRSEVPIMVPDTWDRKQLDVIEAPQDARLLVDAGPGTGKTAVACRRVAWLIDECGVSPSNVWLVSFTRTAVREILNRIRHYLRNAGDASSVKIATIDSHAWAIHSGFDASASLNGSYEENIQSVVKLVRENEGVFEYLEGVEHLIVDEAQDIVGVRADLLMALARRLSGSCGITVFADEAQAIYGFADEDGDSSEPGGHLPERLREHGELGFRETALSTIYRTDQERLLRLFTEVRAEVLARDGDGNGERLENVKDMVRALADREEALVEALDRQNHEALQGTFVLFRRRIDALTAAAFWDTAPHRLRMSGMPTLIEPWLGALLWDRTERRLKQTEFERLWGERVEGRGLAAPTVQRAWELLVKAAGESRTAVSMELLRSRVGRRAPPSDFVRPDFGLGGPVFGTIHGCKGREAESVLLMLPESRSDGANDDEEARVVFVGATRAKLELRVGSGFRFLKLPKAKGLRRACALKTNRGRAAAQVEFGRDGDVTIDGTAGRTLFRTPADVEEAQQWLAGHVDRIVPATARAMPDLNWRYRVVPEGGPPLTYLSAHVGSDLFEVGKSVRKALEGDRPLRPNGGPDHLKIFGACTLVLAPDDPQKDLLHEPWASSGFVLAPALQGFDMVYFKPY